MATDNWVSCWKGFLEWLLYLPHYVNESNYSIIVGITYNHFVTFSYGIAKFGNMLYWTQPTQIYSVDLNPGSLITMVYSSTSSQHLRSVQVVHPSQQPRGKYACWKLKIWCWPLHNLIHSRQSKPWSQLKSRIFGLQRFTFLLFTSHHVWVGQCQCMYVCASILLSQIPIYEMATCRQWYY